MKCISPDQKTQIISLYRDQHRTQAAIALMTGVTQSTICKILQQARRLDANWPTRRELAQLRRGPDRPNFICASQMAGGFDLL